MSLGSRIANRGRVAFSASLVSPPREPLFFLYPSWIRNSSTASPLSQDVPRNEPVAQQKPISIPKHAATLSEDQAVLDKRFNRRKAVSSGDQQTLEIKRVPPKSRPPNISTEDGIASLQSEQSIAKDDTPMSRTEKTARKVLSLKAINDDSKLSASSSRKAYQTDKQTQLQAWAPDWRAVLSTLVQHTPEHGKWLSNALEFSLSSEDARKLLHGIDDYFLEIGDKYGCQIKLGAREDVKVGITSFSISGPASAISKCAAEFLSIAPNTAIAPFKDNSSIEEAPEALKDGERSKIYDSGVRIRNVLADHNRLQYHPSAQVRPEDIKEPSIWTQQSFLDYVRSVTNSRMWSHINRYGFRSPNHHDTVKATILRDLFKDPNVRPAITRVACHEVMQFWITGNHIEDARILFVHMEILKLRMVPETFNILLAGAAKAEDIHAFHFILNLMLNRGITPNGRTWIRFMSAFSDVRIKLHILTAMQKKGLLNHPQTMIEATTQLAYPEIESSLDQNQTQQDFIAHMDSRYGNKWVNNSNANRIIHSLGAHGLISRCWEFLHFMDSRHVVPEIYAVHTILHHCKQATNLAGAVELLRSLPRSMKFEPGEETFRIMFELAWRMRSYNVARVVWRYACLYGATSFRMRQRVFHSMKNASDIEEPKTSRHRWEKFAGPVIVGINHVREHPSQHLERMILELELKRLEQKALQGRLDTGDGSEDLHTSQHTAVLVENQSGGTTPITKSVGGHPTESSHKKNDQSDEPLTESPDLSPEGSKYTPIQLEAYRSSPSFQRHIQQRQLPKILAPWGPSQVGHRVPRYKISILREIIEAEYEMFKHWQPVKPFDEMLTEALELDRAWQAEEGYGMKPLEWFLDGRALKVEIRTKSRLFKKLEWI
ncbi:hypothetical protein ONS95_003774 [Cadophora gregata]|uniref:uncharacterized protein n=1 Tax=Cadophora gregata TaxID=51156 RepID=UPI0026DBE825|nr:uncharacterized protein ONS95_003774 [Cadophora gregata]KAK0107064.1 hypothetical protein ONS95_003774 [Cadophora gregata]